MKRSKILLIIFVIILGCILFFWSEPLDFYSEISLRLPKVEERVTELLKQEAEKKILIPPPLRYPKETPQAFLTQAGIIQWTNIKRKEYGLLPLKENAKLNESAEMKVQDMFIRQYFSHFSPSGVGVGDLVEETSYEFIAIGENLALGDFQNDKVLIEKWMDSIGHRENILNAYYQEIGVAVQKGMFEGKSTWLAVQHFGLPLSACPQPDEILRTEIELNQSQIEELQRTLWVLQAKIKATRPKRGPDYNQRIEQYNIFVSQYNALVKETETLINEYNAQVILFNECVAGMR